MKFFISMVFLLLVMGCDVKQEVLGLKTKGNEEKVWVFVQLNVKEEADVLESYYYYAKISKNIYEQIGMNSLNKGFILLENVKYWGNDNLIYDYADEESAGELIFRIEDIAKIDLINVEPIIGKGLEQFDAKSEQKIKAVDETLRSNKAINQDSQ